jgi:hypothetical protein
MHRCFCLLLLFLLPSSLNAQNASPEGSWRGELITDAFRGDLELTFSRPAGSWSIAISAKVQERVSSGEAIAVRVDCDSVIFTSTVGGAATRYSGTLHGDSLSGVLEARIKGELLGRGIWRLARQVRAAGFKRDSARAVTISAQEVFDEAWKVVDMRYGNFPSKGIDWNLIHAMYRNSAAAARTDEELASVLSLMLSHLNDKHISLRAGNRLYRPAGEIDTSQYVSDSVTAKRIRGAHHTGLGGNWRYGWLADSVGYIRIDAFQQLDPTRAFLDTALNEFRNARALVIDLRKHFGGDDRTANAVINRFATRRELYLKRRTREGNGHADFLAPHDFYYEPGGSWQYTRPVMILTSSRTVSAGENFLIGMRRLPQVTLVGDITAGAFADVGHFTLGNGWQLNIPYNRIVDANEFSWEGLGVEPDIRVVPTRVAILRGEDPVLDTALLAIRASSAER